MTDVYVSEPVAEEVLTELGKRFTVHLGYGPDRVAYDQIASEVEAAMLRSEPFDAKRIENSPKLRIIARHGVGYDTVDVAAATEAHVVVTIVPGGNANAVAEHALALMLSLMRRIPVADAELRTAVWPKTKSHLVGTEIAGRVLGVVGAGRIGRKVAQLGLGCGMQLIAYDPFPVQAPDGVEMVELDYLIRTADVISLHLPATPETTGMVDAEWLAKMKPSAVLVNTSRAGLVDETALIEALAAGTIAGAALDVIEAEGPGAPVTVAGRPIDPSWNLVLTPHIGAQTEEAMTNVGLAATEEIVRVLGGQEPNHPVNSIIKD